MRTGAVSFYGDSEKKSMNWILCAFLVLASPWAWAFNYSVEEESLRHPSALSLHELSQIFAGKGYQSLSDINLTSAGFLFDRAFVSARWEKSLLLKAGLQAPPDLEGKVIEEPSLGLQAFHFRYEGVSYLLVALNLSNAEFRELVKPWLRSTTASRWSWLLPSAQAAGAECAAFTSNSTQGVASTANYIESNEILKGIGRCGADALHGVLNSATASFDFFKKLATNPKALWSEMKESFSQLKHFALNIQSELKQVFENLKGLPTEQKVQLACTFTGELIGSAAQAFVSGAALAKALPFLLLKLKTSAALLSKVVNLEKMGLKIPDKSLLAKEVMSCAY